MVPLNPTAGACRGHVLELMTSLAVESSTHCLQSFLMTTVPASELTGASFLLLHVHGKARVDPEVVHKAGPEARTTLHI